MRKERFDECLSWGGWAFEKSPYRGYRADNWAGPFWSRGWYGSGQGRGAVIIIIIIRNRYACIACISWVYDCWSDCWII